MSEDKEKQEKKPDPRTVRQKLKKVLGTSVLCLLALLFLLFLFRDTLIEAGIRSFGSHITGSKVTVENFHSSLEEGVSITNLAVYNPPGYDGIHLVSVRSVKIKADLTTLFSRMPVINYLLISGVNICYEAKMNGRSNLSDIQKNIRTALGISEEEAKEASVKQADDDEVENGDFPLLQRLECTDMRVSLQKVTLPLPDIRLKNLGGNSSLFDSLLGTGRMLTKSIDSTVGSLAAGLGSVADAALKVENSGKNVINKVKEFFTLPATKNKEKK